jgi:hypothetical protein
MSIEAHVNEAPARLLAWMLAARGCGAREVERLDALGAFPRIGVDRRRFTDLSRAVADESGARLCEWSWLCAADQAEVDRLLEPVVDVPMRLLLCRLTAAALGPDDSVASNHRLVLDHVMARWRIDPADVALHDGALKA